MLLLQEFLINLGFSGGASEYTYKKEDRSVRVYLEPTSTSVNVHINSLQYNEDYDWESNICMEDFSCKKMSQLQIILKLLLK